MKLLAAAFVLFACSSAFADDVKLKIASHLQAANPEIEITETRTDQGQPVVCGTITIRPNANSWSTATFAYAVDEDMLWTGKEEWLKEPQKMGILNALKYCRETRR